MANSLFKKIFREERRVQVQPMAFDDEDYSIASVKKNQLDNYDELESYKKLRKRRVKKAFIRMTTWFFIILFVPLFVFFSLVIISPKEGHNFFGYSVYLVTSTSMVGVFNKGDCIIIQKVEDEKDIQLGSDITFVRRSDGEVVTHRVIDITINEQGDKEYVTKGVNNPSADQESVLFEDIIGKRVNTSAGLGNIIEFFRTPYGIVTFLVGFILVLLGINYVFKLSDDITSIGVK